METTEKGHGKLGKTLHKVSDTYSMCPVLGQKYSILREGIFRVQKPFSYSHVGNEFET